VKITAKKRKGKSSVSVKDGFKTLLLVLKTVLLFNPLRFFVPISFFCFLLGILELSYEYYLKGVFNVSTSALLLFMTSLIVFLFGMISEQISELKRIEK
jgi:energy-coupling factor transporter transmembrane protein EcfT